MSSRSRQDKTSHFAVSSEPGGSQETEEVCYFKIHLTDTALVQEVSKPQTTRS